MVDINMLPYVLTVAVLAGLGVLVLLSMLAEGRSDRRRRRAAPRHAASPLLLGSGELPSASIEKAAVPEL